MTRYLLDDLVRNCKEKVDRDNNPYEYFVAGDHMETERPRLTMRGRFDPWSWYAASRLTTSHHSRGVEDK